MEALIRCLGKLVDQGKNYLNAQPKSYQLFTQMWIVIVSYLTMNQRDIEHGPFRRLLTQLAALTPYLSYLKEFSLMIRLGSNKDILERFIT